MYRISNLSPLYMDTCIGRGPEILKLSSHGLPRTGGMPWPNICATFVLKSQKNEHMRFHTRKWVKPEDLNANGTLFGGRVLAWVDAEAALDSIIQLESNKVVTQYMSEINFMRSATQGDIIEIRIEVFKFGTTSISLNCEFRNKMTHE